MSEAKTVRKYDTKYMNTMHVTTMLLKSPSTCQRLFSERNTSINVDYFIATSRLKID